MGNTGIIKGKGTNLGLYLHWNGGYDSVLAFTQYCKLKGYRSPENDCYGLARLCQVVTNFFGGGLSVGILNMTGAEHMTKEIATDYGGDNGIYELEDWNIITHWTKNGVIAEAYESHEGYDLTKFLLHIDSHMPVEEQLGKEFINAEEVNVAELKAGDTVYIYRFDKGYEKHTVVGIAPEDYFCNGFVGRLPYVDLYEIDGNYMQNGNNFIRTKTIRRTKEN